MIRAVLISLGVTYAGQAMISMAVSDGRSDEGVNCATKSRSVVLARSPLARVVRGRGGPNANLAVACSNALESRVVLGPFIINARDTITPAQFRLAGRTLAYSEVRRHLNSVSVRLRLRTLQKSGINVLATTVPFPARARMAKHLRIAVRSDGVAAVIARNDDLSRSVYLLTSRRCALLDQVASATDDSLVLRFTAGRLKWNAGGGSRSSDVPRQAASGRGQTGPRAVLDCSPAASED